MGASRISTTMLPGCEYSLSLVRPVVRSTAGLFRIAGGSAGRGTVAGFSRLEQRGDLPQSALVDAGNVGEGDAGLDAGGAFVRGRRHGSR